MELVIAHDPQRRRFSTIVEGHDAYVEYLQAGKRMTITHTWVPQEIGGQGIAGELVRAVLDHARAQGLKVSPQCPYADAWMRKHPGYEDLRA